MTVRNEPIDVIFLDIDGVMLPFGGSCSDDDNVSSSALFPESTLFALSLILKAIPTVRLVLSSTWRVRSDYCDDIIKQFQAYGRRHDGSSGGGPLSCIHEFYDTTSIINHSERQWEIYEWLSSRKEYLRIRAWVALDDEELVDGDANARYRTYFEGRVVKTDSAVGLTGADAEAAITLLEQQIRTAASNRF